MILWTILFNLTSALLARAKKIASSTLLNTWKTKKKIIVFRFSLKCSPSSFANSTLRKFKAIGTSVSTSLFLAQVWVFSTWFWLDTSRCRTSSSSWSGMQVVAPLVTSRSISLSRTSFGTTGMSRSREDKLSRNLFLKKLQRLLGKSQCFNSSNVTHAGWRQRESGV